MKMQPLYPDVFFGPVFFASLVSALDNTPAGLAISKEKNATNQLKIALTAVLGGKASKLRIDYIASGKGMLEVADHVNKVKQLLSDQMDFEVKHPSNSEIFYLETGIPRGFYIEGLSPEDEKFLNNLFVNQHLIISSVEMKALGFNGSDPYPVLNKILPLRDRIILTGKNGSVCVIAESKKLQQLKQSIPQPIVISHAQAIAILYKSGFKEEKYGPSILKSLQTIAPNPTLLSEAFKKLSISGYVDLENSENLKVVATPEEYAKILKICDECLQPLDINLCRAIYLETGTFKESITSELLATWLGDDDFALLTGPVIIIGAAGLEKIRALQREWLDIDSDYINLLRYFSPKNDIEGTSADRIIEKSRELAIIPEELPVEVRESTRGDFQISVPAKYKKEILKGFTNFFSEHIQEVYSTILEILYQQTGMREIKPALARLQQDKRVGKGFVSCKNNRNYLVFANKDDIYKFESNWMRYPVSINSFSRSAVILQAKSLGCRYQDFKSCCHYLNIVLENSSPFFGFRCLKPQTQIKMDTENLRKLNCLLDKYVSITPSVHRFIVTILPKMRTSVEWRMVEDSKHYVIAKEIQEKVFDEVMAAVPDLEGLILNWKVQNNYVPLEYQKLTPIQGNVELEQYVGRRSSFDSLAGNMQRLMVEGESTQIFSDYPLNLNDSKGSFNTELSNGPHFYSTPIPSPDPSPHSSPNLTPIPSRAPSPRLIGGNSPGSSSSFSSTDFSSKKAAEEVISFIL
jgi:hypothetical protein